jgi:UMF1 family MFS transporter
MVSLSPKITLNKAKVLLKRPVISWALYDFANTSFAVIIITVVFPVFFINIIAPAAKYGQNFGDLMWGLASGVSMLIGSFLAPVFGTLADTSRSKNRYLILLTILCIIFCSLLYFTGAGTIVRAMLLFIAANFFYQISMMFYNSFLPELSEKGDTGFLSGFGFSLGYLGGLIALSMIYPLLGRGLESSNIPFIKLTFIITALFFLVFSIPSFIFLKDKKTESANSFIRHGWVTGFFSNIALLFRISFKKLRQTFIKMKADKNLIKFLVAYFLFSNAFSILAVYAAIYGRSTLNLSLQEIAFLFILGHFPVIISSIFFGWLADRIGPKRVIVFTLLAWSLVIILVSAFNIKAVFYTAFIIISVITGSTLIASRALMNFLTPFEREAEYFSFYAIGGKVSSILGPVVFGIISYFTKSQRLALLSTLIFLVSGLITILTVKVPARREAI